MADKKPSAPSKALRDLQTKSQEALWYTADRKGGSDPNGIKVARAITKSATAREVSYVPNRWRNLVYFRETTGRPALSQVAYGMAKRPNSFTSYYSSFQFSGTKSRFIGQCMDIYTNRLLGHQTHISMIPSQGTWEERKDCESWEEWIEAGFDQLDFWPERSTMGQESFMYGTGVLYFCDDGFGVPKLKSINPDCVLLSDPDDDDPYDVIIRFWGKKTELLERYKDNPEACEAIAKAQSAYPAFYFGTGTLDCTDVVPYLIGYTRPLGKTPGRHVEVIGDYALIDEKWEYPIPLEQWQFNKLPGSWFGQGIAELLLQIAQWIDGLLILAQESEQRGGVGKWLYDENSNVNPDALGDSVAAAVSYLGKPPEYITPEGIGQWFLAHIEYLTNLGRSIVHVSEQAVKGEAPKAFTSGVALEKYAEIDDQTFLEKIGRLEEFDRRCAYQLMMLGKRLNCNFIRKGDRREIKWEELKFNPKFRINNIQAFNVGRLSQTVAGRIEVLKEMYAEGTIDKKLYIKYQQTPDITGMYSELNSQADDVQGQLDKLVKSDEYIPPSPYMDYDFALAAVESRMNREESLGSPQEVLDRLSMWRATVKNFQAQNNTPDTVPGTPPGSVPAPGMSAPGPGGAVPFGLQPPAAPPMMQQPPGVPGQGPVPPPNLPVTANNFAPA